LLKEKDGRRPLSRTEEGGRKLVSRRKEADLKDRGINKQLFGGEPHPGGEKRLVH